MRDGADDPFDDFFDGIERMMDEMSGRDAAGFASETHIDVYEQEDQLRLIADLPGVSKDAIKLQCDVEILTISAADDRREYDERVRLPTKVDEHSATASFNNGVLEATFDTRSDSASINLD